MPEAKLEQAGNGLTPVSDGWFVLNARDAAWIRHKTFGLETSFELSGPVARSRDDLEPRSFGQLGIGLHWLEPGFYSPTPLAESVDAETTSGKEAYAPYGHWVNDGESPL